MMDAAEFLGLGKYIGGQNAPIGTFVNLRTLAYFQQASDGTLPADGNVWIMITTSGTSTTTQIATAVNLIVPGGAYVAGSFHVRTSGDNAQQAGTGADDA
ncbi:MAG: hypothetical protein ACR2H5_07340 [Ktedonobacteraceae bacterium]